MDNVQSPPSDVASITFDTNIMLLQTLSYFEHDLIHDQGRALKKEAGKCAII